jgi:hypothetical protein
MRRYYVDISGVSQEFLDFLGYVVVYEEEEFKMISHKGATHIVDKQRPRLYVDDANDASLLSGAFANRDKMPLPSKEKKKND